MRFYFSRHLLFRTLVGKDTNCRLHTNVRKACSSTKSLLVFVFSFFCFFSFSPQAEEYKPPRSLFSFETRGLHLYWVFGILKATSNGLRQQSFARRAVIKVNCSSSIVQVLCFVQH